MSKKLIRAAKQQKRLGLVGSVFLLFLAGDEAVMFYDEGMPLLAILEIGPLLWVYLGSALVMFLGAFSPALRPLHSAVLLIMIPIQSWIDPREFGALACAVLALLHLFRGGLFLRGAVIKGFLVGLGLAALLVVPAAINLRSLLHLLPVYAGAITLLVLGSALGSGRFLAAFSPRRGRLSLEGARLGYRERMFTKEFLRGMLFKQIAYEHGVSESTVHNTLAHAYKKLGVSDSHELRALGAKYQIVD